jgi:methionine-rich copper-binding protein CopC
MPRSSRPFCSALIALVAVLALSGCGWKGEGKNVAAAIVATSQVKTRSFTGSMKMDMSKMTGTGGAAATAAPKSMTMTFSGAIDTSNESSPKMLMKMNAEGQETSMVAPGDGKFYITTAGKSYYTTVDPAAANQQTIDPQKIYVALGDAVGGFQKAQSIVNAQGKPVDTVAAKVNKKKLCGPVFDAFGEAMNQSDGLTSGLGSSAGSRKLNENGKKMMQTFCQTMLKSDPRVWFGIDNGKLTDVELTAQLTIPFAGQMGLEVQYHEYNQDQPQTGFDAPANATPMDSMNPATPGSSI